jgi:hypothetical protein
MSSKMMPMLGLLPQGVNLGDTNLFGSLNPMNGWAPKANEVANAWTQTGQAPIDYFSQFMDPKRLGKITDGRFAGDPSAQWNRFGGQLVKAAANPYVPRVPHRDSMSQAINNGLVP